MTHTFFFYYFWRRLIYAPKYPLLIFLLMLGAGILYSMLLEFVKKQARKALRKPAANQTANP